MTTSASVVPGQNQLMPLILQFMGDNGVHPMTAGEGIGPVMKVAGGSSTGTRSPVASAALALHTFYSENSESFDNFFNAAISAQSSPGAQAAASSLGSIDWSAVSSSTTLPPQLNANVFTPALTQSAENLSAVTQTQLSLFLCAGIYVEIVAVGMSAVAGLATNIRGGGPSVSIFITGGLGVGIGFGVSAGPIIGWTSPTVTNLNNLSEVYVIYSTLTAPYGVGLVLYMTEGLELVGVGVGPAIGMGAGALVSSHFEATGLNL